MDENNIEMGGVGSNEPLLQYTQRRSKYVNNGDGADPSDNEPLKIVFYPRHFIWGSQLINITDPLAVALLTATLAAVDIEYYEATILFILFNFTLLFGRHLIFMETDIQSFIRKKSYKISPYQSIIKVSFLRGNMARLRDVCIVLLCVFGSRLLWLSYTYSRPSINWRYFDMFSVSCIALLLSFFQLYAYIYCLSCVQIPEETEKRLIANRPSKRYPARINMGVILLDGLYGKELMIELIKVYQVHIVWMKKKSIFGKEYQIPHPHETTIYNQLGFNNPFKVDQPINQSYQQQQQ